MLRRWCATQTRGRHSSYASGLWICLRFRLSAKTLQCPKWVAFTLVWSCVSWRINPLRASVKNSSWVWSLIAPRFEASSCTTIKNGEGSSLVSLPVWWNSSSHAELRSTFWARKLIPVSRWIIPSVRFGLYCTVLCCRHVDSGEQSSLMLSLSELFHILMYLVGEAFLLKTIRISLCRTAGCWECIWCEDCVSVGAERYISDGEKKWGCNSEISADGYI